MQVIDRVERADGELLFDFAAEYPSQKESTTSPVLRMSPSVLISRGW
jgi:hypothetical protein